MNKKLDIHNFWRSNIFIILIFAVMSIMSGMLLWHGKFVIVSSDFYFHWQRIIELKDSIIHGNFTPMVTLNEFNQSGSAVMSMYPMLNFFPMVFLSFFIKSFVNLFYFIFILKNFFALLVGYYSCYSYSKNKKISFLFSTAYTLTAFVLTFNTIGYEVGATAAIIYLPLILFGSFQFFINGKWMQLALGMSAIILCHILTAAFAIVLLIVLFIINIRKIMDKQKILNLCKAVILTVLLTSIFWIPFVGLQIQNHVSLPLDFIPIEGISTSEFISTVFDFSSFPANISLFSFIGAILSIVRYKKMNDFSKQIFWISICFILICSRVFPWSIIQHTFIKDILQSPWRLYVIPQVLLSYLFAEHVILLLKNNSHKTIYYILVVLSIIMVHLNIQQNNVNNYRTNPHLTQPNNLLASGIITNNNEFKNVINSSVKFTDYNPKESLPYTLYIVDHKALYGDKKTLSINLHGDGKLSFNSPKKIDKLSLPFLYYHGINYQVKLDGKTVKGYPNKNALMTINNVRKGKHHVRIIVHKTKVEIASYILSLIGLLILLGTILKNFLKKRKNK